MSCSCKNVKPEFTDEFEGVSTESLKEMLRKCELQEDFANCIVIRDYINKNRSTITNKIPTAYV